jgi:NADH pyrophosphatase NudC (nudix superfamily)
VSVLDIADAAMMIRKSINRQIATTPPGKMLSSAHPRELAELTANIVGNLAYGVLEFAHAAVAAAAVDAIRAAAATHEADRAEIHRLDTALAETRAEHARILRAAQSIADRAPRPSSPPGNVERCTSCGTPTHPTTSDDRGRCAQCSREANDEPAVRP